MFAGWADVTIGFTSWDMEMIWWVVVAVTTNLATLPDPTIIRRIVEEAAVVLISVIHFGCWLCGFKCFSTKSQLNSKSVGSPTSVFFNAKLESGLV